MSGKMVKDGAILHDCENLGICTRLLGSEVVLSR